MHPQCLSNIEDLSVLRSLITSNNHLNNYVFAALTYPPCRCMGFPYMHFLVYLLLMKSLNARVHCAYCGNCNLCKVSNTGALSIFSKEITSLNVNILHTNAAARVVEKLPRSLPRGQIGRSGSQFLCSLSDVVYIYIWRFLVCIAIGILYQLS